MPMKGIDLIRAERVRQIHTEGYQPNNDIGRSPELAMAAVSYTLSSVNDMVDSGYDSLYFWPWDEDYWNPKDTRSNLIRAGALIAAALDSLELEDA